MERTTPDEALLQLIYENERIIFKICNTYCKNKSDREDLYQEIIYQLWKSGKTYNNKFTFSTWMYRVALNVAISFFRRKSTSPDIAFEDHYPDIANDPDASGKLEEDTRHLHHFIRDLKELDRAIILLYLEEKTYREIAEIVGISETKTATRINRIKNSLRVHFNHLNH